VSNLTFISKLVERAALQQLLAHIESNNMLPSYQSAYRTGYSTETALLNLDDLLTAMESCKATALVAIDLSAAFDTVNHNFLCRVLQANFGI
jgi:hypothetical protein